MRFSGSGYIRVVSKYFNFYIFTYCSSFLTFLILFFFGRAGKLPNWNYTHKVNAFKQHIFNKL